MTDEQVAQSAYLEGATMPDGTKYAGTKYIPKQPGPAPAEAETDTTEGQPDQPDDIGDDAQEGTE